MRRVILLFLQRHERKIPLAKNGEFPLLFMGRVGFPISAAGLVVTAPIGPIIWAGGRNVGQS